MGVPIRGFNVIIRLVQDGEIQEFPFKSAEITSKREIQTDGYIGEDYDRRTSVHSGYGGRLVTHMETAKAIRFSDALDRAAMGANISFSLLGVFHFPDGTRQRYQWTGLAFGEDTINIDERKNKIPLNLTFEAEKKKPLANF